MGPFSGSFPPILAQPTGVERQLREPNQNLFLLWGGETGNREDSRVQRVPFSHLLVCFLPSAFYRMRVGVWQT